MNLTTINVYCALLIFSMLGCSKKQDNLPKYLVGTYKGTFISDEYVLTNGQLEHTLDTVDATLIVEEVFEPEDLSKFECDFQVFGLKIKYIEPNSSNTEWHFCWYSSEELIAYEQGGTQSFPFHYKVNIDAKTISTFSAVYGGGDRYEYRGEYVKME